MALAVPPSEAQAFALAAAWATEVLMLEAVAWAMAWALDWQQPAWAIAVAVASAMAVATAVAAALASPHAVAPLPEVVANTEAKALAVACRQT